jgi:biotin carboxylase
MTPHQGDSLIDFMTEDYTLPQKHVIAARITAENPDEGFKPTSGRIDRIRFQSSPTVWGYFSVGTNGAVHEFADSQVCRDSPTPTPPWIAPHEFEASFHRLDEGD